MAKQRVLVDPLAPPPRLQPRATPVDTFHRPNVGHLNEGPSEVQQLTSALADFQPTLQSIAINAKNRDNLRQRTAGNEKVLLEKRLQTRKALADAVRRGEIPEARNPAFLQAMQEQVARIEADRYDVALREAYSKAESQHDPDITSFMAGFTSKYLTDHGLTSLDATSQAIIDQTIQRSQASLQHHHVGRWEAEQSQLARDRLYVEIQTTVRSRAIFNSPESLAANIKARVDSLVTNGMNGTEANQITAEAIAAVAREREDESILEIGEAVETGHGKLGRTKHTRDLFAQTRQWIENQRDHNAARDRQIANQAIEDETDGLSTNIQQALAANPWDASDDLKASLERLNRVNPDKWRTLMSFREALRNQDPRNINEDTDDARLLRSRVANGVATDSEVMKAVTNGVISNNTYNQLISELAKAKTLRTPLNDPSLRSDYEYIGKALRDGANDTYSTTGRAIVSNNYQALWLATMKHMEAKGADPYDMWKRSQEIKDAFIQKEVPQYLQPGGKKPEGGTTSPVPMFLNEEDLKASIKEALAGQGRIADEAKRRGVDVSVVADEEAQKIKAISNKK